MGTLELAREERRDLADFCTGLSPADWDALSLCVGWRVRDVVAHIVSYEGLGPVGFAGRLVRAGLNPHRANREAAARLGGSDPAQLLQLLRVAQQPRGLLTAFGGGGRPETGHGLGRGPRDGLDGRDDHWVDPIPTREMLILGASNVTRLDVREVRDVARVDGVGRRGVRRTCRRAEQSRRREQTASSALAAFSSA